MRGFYILFIILQFYGSHAQNDFKVFYHEDEKGNATWTSHQSFLIEDNAIVRLNGGYVVLSHSSGLLFELAGPGNFSLDSIRNYILKMYGAEKFEQHQNQWYKLRSSEMHNPITFNFRHRYSQPAVLFEYPNYHRHSINSKSRFSYLLKDTDSGEENFYIVKVSFFDKEIDDFRSIWADTVRSKSGIVNLQSIDFSNTNPPYLLMVSDTVEEFDRYDMIYFTSESTGGLIPLISDDTTAIEAIQIGFHFEQYLNCKKAHDYYSYAVEQSDLKFYKDILAAFKSRCMGY